MMGVSTSTYYYKPKVPRAEREKRDAQLREQIEVVQMTFPRAGYRMVGKNLARQGLRVNSKRLRRVMKEHGLQAQIRRRFIRTTDSDHPYPIHPNLLKGKTVTTVNQVWVADITYIRIQNGFVFLAVVLDLYSRKVVGWAISKRIDHELTLAALKVALENRKPGSELIHHSDRGVQYACHAYVDLLRANGIAISMSRKGNPYDNAFCESFMKTLKQEEVYLWNYETYLDVVERVPFFIEEVYNKKRLHSALGYVTPEEFEQNPPAEVKEQPVGQPTQSL
jgi:transposase InsO family protein